MHHLPNIISLFRVILVLPIAYFLYDEAWERSFILIFIAGISDAFDGFLARAFHWKSRLGSILDPLADKLLLGVLFISLSYKDIIPNWLMLLVLSRDSIILIGAIAYQMVTHKLNIAPLFSSKVNTALQIIFILLMMYHLAIHPLSATLINTMQIAVALSTLISGMVYIICWTAYYKKHFSKNKENK